MNLSDTLFVTATAGVGIGVGACGAKTYGMLGFIGGFAIVVIVAMMLISIISLFSKKKLKKRGFSSIPPRHVTKSDDTVQPPPF